MKNDTTPENPIRMFIDELKNGNIHSYAFLIVLIYISILNVFVFSAESTLIVIQFLVLIIIFYRKNKSDFIRDWLPIVAAFIGFEFLRAQADDLSPFYNSTLYAAYDLELTIFPTIPTIFFQNVFLKFDWVLQVATFFYITYFYFPFLTGFLIWIFRRDIFKSYFTGFMILSYIGVILHFFLPTAPPWFAQLDGIADIDRILWDKTVIGSLQGIQLFHYFDRSNYVAALPSLHTGWTAYTSFFLIHTWGKKAAISLIIPIMVAFSVVLTGEHFLIDVLLGFLLAYLTAIKFFRNRYQELYTAIQVKMDKFEIKP